MPQLVRKKQKINDKREDAAIQSLRDTAIKLKLLENRDGKYVITDRGEGAIKAFFALSQGNFREPSTDDITDFLKLWRACYEKAKEDLGYKNTPESKLSQEQKEKIVKKAIVYFLKVFSGKKKGEDWFVKLAKGMDLAGFFDLKSPSTLNLDERLAELIVHEDPAFAHLLANLYKHLKNTTAATVASDFKRAYGYADQIANGYLYFVKSKEDIENLENHINNLINDKDPLQASLNREVLNYVIEKKFGDGSKLRDYLSDVINRDFSKVDNTTVLLTWLNVIKNDRKFWDRYQKVEGYAGWSAVESETTILTRYAILTKTYDAFHDETLFEAFILSLGTAMGGRRVFLSPQILEILGLSISEFKTLYRLAEGETVKVSDLYRELSILENNNSKAYNLLVSYFPDLRVSNLEVNAKNEISLADITPFQDKTQFASQLTFGFFWYTAPKVLPDLADPAFGLVRMLSDTNAYATAILVEGGGATVGEKGVIMRYYWNREWAVAQLPFKAVIAFKHIKESFFRNQIALNLEGLYYTNPWATPKADIGSVEGLPPTGAFKSDTAIEELKRIYDKFLTTAIGAGVMPGSKLVFDVRNVRSLREYIGYLENLLSGKALHMLIPGKVQVHLRVPIALASYFYELSKVLPSGNVIPAAPFFNSFTSHGEFSYRKYERTKDGIKEREEAGYVTCTFYRYGPGVWSEAHADVQIVGKDKYYQIFTKGVSYQEFMNAMQYYLNWYIKNQGKNEGLARQYVSKHANVGVAYQMVKDEQGNTMYKVWFYRVRVDKGGTLRAIKLGYTKMTAEQFEKMFGSAFISASSVSGDVRILFEDGHLRGGFFLLSLPPDTLKNLKAAVSQYSDKETGEKQKNLFAQISLTKKDIIFTRYYTDENGKQILMKWWHIRKGEANPFVAGAVGTTKDEEGKEEVVYGGLLMLKISKTKIATRMLHLVEHQNIFTIGAEGERNFLFLNLLNAHSQYKTDVILGLEGEGTKLYLESWSELQHMIYVYAPTLLSNGYAIPDIWSVAISPDSAKLLLMREEYLAYTINQLFTGAYVPPALFLELSQISTAISKITADRLKAACQLTFDNGNYTTEVIYAGGNRWLVNFAGKGQAFRFGMGYEYLGELIGVEKEKSLWDLSLEKWNEGPLKGKTMFGFTFGARSSGTDEINAASTYLGFFHLGLGSAGWELALALAEKILRDNQEDLGAIIGNIRHIGEMTTVTAGIGRQKVSFDTSWATTNLGFYIIGGRITGDLPETVKDARIWLGELGLTYAKRSPDKYSLFYLEGSFLTGTGKREDKNVNVEEITGSVGGEITFITP